MTIADYNREQARIQFEQTHDYLIEFYLGFADRIETDPRLQDDFAKIKAGQTLNSYDRLNAAADLARSINEGYYDDLIVTAANDANQYQQQTGSGGRSGRNGSGST